MDVFSTKKDTETEEKEKVVQCTNLYISQGMRSLASCYMLTANFECWFFMSGWQSAVSKHSKGPDFYLTSLACAKYAHICQKMSNKSEKKNISKTDSAMWSVHFQEQVKNTGYSCLSNIFGARERIWITNSTWVMSLWNDIKTISANNYLYENVKSTHKSIIP